MANREPGIDEIVTTVALTMKAFLDGCREIMPDLKTVYDEKLSYETTVDAFRAKNKENKEKVEFYPMFAYRRSVLRYVDPAGPGRRASGIFPKRDMAPSGVKGQSQVFRLLHGEFDLNFLYITKNTRDLEKFEILYLCDEGIATRKELTVDLTAEIGQKLTYYADYPPLEDKTFESDNVYYKMIQGSIKIRGFYPVLIGQGKHIRDIKLKIQDVAGQVYSEKHITDNSGSPV